MGKYQNLLVLQGEGGWEKEERWHRAVGAALLAMPSIRRLFSPVPFCFHPSAPIYNLSCHRALPSSTWHQRCLYSLRVFAQSHYAHTSNYYVAVLWVHSLWPTIFLPRWFIPKASPTTLMQMWEGQPPPICCPGTASSPAWQHLPP